MKIKDLAIGASGRVVGYSGVDREYRHKLLRMGLVKGATVTLIRKAPMGDPVEVKLKGFNLTLRKAESEVVEIDSD